MNKPLIIADDYGYSDAVNQGILELLNGHAIDGASCMVNSPQWPEYAKTLNELKCKEPQIQVGLHFDLTDDGLPSHPNARIQKQSIGQWILKAHLFLINRKAIKQEFERQYDVFCEHFGMAPDFVDGHQHVHVLLGIRHVVLDVLVARDFLGWVRQCRSPLHRIASRPYKIKSVILALLSLGFGSLARHRGFKTNRDFLGIYDFDANQNYEALVDLWVKQSDEQTVMMCHPGIQCDVSDPDPIWDARNNEYRVLSQYNQFKFKR